MDFCTTNYVPGMDGILSACNVGVIPRQIDQFLRSMSGEFHEIELSGSE